MALLPHGPNGTLGPPTEGVDFRHHVRAMNITAQLIGYPRIGPNRELKWALEKAWAGRMEADAFAARIAELRHAHLDEQREAIGSTVDDYFLYDEVLETAMMLGIAPRRWATSTPMRSAS